ncbi:MAG: hypothetical protein AB2598_12220, partial [Candidatus Thiodiazotropha sp.]
PRVENLYTDPRSRVIIEDAKTYFATSGKKYDVIVSEPSNPWVSGVSGLFSTEFYHDVKRYLKPNGVLVQWVQVYEISPELVATVYLALRENFADIHLYQIAGSDIAIVASMEELKADYSAPFKHAALRNELEEININQPTDLEFRKLAGKTEQDIIFGSLAKNPNSDYFPVLDIGAAKARFKKSDAGSLYMFYRADTLKRLADEKNQLPGEVTEAPRIKASILRNEKKQFHQKFKHYIASDSVPLITSTLAEGTAKKLFEILAYCNSNQEGKSVEEVSNQLINFVQWSYPYSTREELSQLFDSVSACESLLNESGVLWLGAHRAWLDGDIPRVKKLTKKYLDNLRVIETTADKRLLIFNLASHMLSGSHADVKSYYGKVTPAISKDLEIRGLLNLVDSTLVEKE